MKKDLGIYGPERQIPRHSDRIAISGIASKRMYATVLATSMALAFSAGQGIAQPTAETEQRQVHRQHYNVQAGSLAQVLRAIASTAGIPLTFSPEQVKNLHSAGLQGSYSLSEAFDLVLHGTSLHMVAVPNQGGYILKGAETKVGNALTTTLPQVTVQGQFTSGTTEGSQSYGTRSMSTATGLSLSQRQTPQSTTVLTQQRIQDRAITNLDDAVQDIVGLTLRKAGNEMSAFTSRGFIVDNLMYDGLPVKFNSEMYSADLAIFDRVEVVRGAVGLTQGAGTPSAAINMVRKRPVAEPMLNLSAQTGSWNNNRLTVDASNALNEAGTLRGRVVGVYQDKDSFIDAMHNERKMLYGVLEADISHATTITGGASVQREKNRGTTIGQPTYLNGTFLPVSRSKNFNFDWSIWDKDIDFVFGEIAHRFDNGWTARAVAVQTKTDMDFFLASLGKVSNSENLTFSGTNYLYQDNQNSLNLHASGPFEWFGKAHELVIGYSRLITKFNAVGRSAGLLGNSPPLNWDPSSISYPTGNLPITYEANTRDVQNSLYATARFRLSDPLTLIAGSRISWFDYTDTRNSTKNYEVKREMTPYVGVVYDLSTHHSAYASWTRSFKPQNVYDATGSLLEPVTGTQVEAGLKGEYFDGALNAGVSLFQIKQQKRAMLDYSGPSPCPGSVSPFCSRAAGEVESKGIELEISGQLAPGWQVAGGYTYVDAKYTRDQVASNVGKEFDTDQPRHQFKLSSAYQFAGDLDKWRMGGALYAQNAIYNAGTYSGSNYLVRQKTYALLDLMVGYRINKNLDIRLNFNNVFDKHYYQTIGNSRSSNMPGTPRNLLLTLNYSL